jgi:hypothetical protein
MTSWILRLSARATVVLTLMLLVEFAAFVMYRESGVNRLYWVPVSFALVGYAGFDTVSRLPLIWGAFIGGVLAGITNVLSWMIGSLVNDGKFVMPAEAEPLLVGTSLVMALIIGAIVGGAAGTMARGRRRKRSRRSALGKLAYGAFDEPDESPPDQVANVIAIPMAHRFG